MATNPFASAATDRYDPKPEEWRDPVLTTWTVSSNV